MTDFTEDLDFKPARARSSNAEHNLQTKIAQWTVEAIDVPHLFFSSDSAAARGKFSRVFDKMRGIRKGTCDTFLLVPGFVIGVELKSPGQKPTEDQKLFGGHMVRAGHHWDWCDSVIGYHNILLRLGVPLRQYAGILAEGHDATLAGAAIKRKEAKTGVPARGRVQPRYTMSVAQVRRARKAGVRV